ncbi:acetylornithine transaminase [Alkalihalobacillus sp. LMS6]|uniref:acetylornithine transaminase n=1 Tax=Alkalihalobacillus sp. LMS6 TaxID=2924034 RepID=UPI0020D0F743|nr:acetylornithine transaminase [Alkalihalobacillus sp. LMS6]UTR05041.1 acetylornithine transaminase [Alkalihalobacillus sp. LMS6]
MSYLFPTYTKKEIQLTQGKGSYVYSQDGTCYQDFMSGIAVTNLGHGHPAIVQALHKQADLLWHGSNLFHYEIQEQAAKMLVEKSVCDAVFFCNSGAEANEAAIKLARKASGKSHIITMNQSFHGRTLGSMAATGQEAVHQGYGPMLDSFTYVPFNDSEALELAVQPETAAIMIEVVQGEGGVHILSEQFASTIMKLKKEKNLLVIIDEIQTGIGRTGTFFAYEHYQLDPDVITVAKGLGNGFPVGAMLGKSNLIEHFQAGAHGSTFGGNPLAMAVVKAVLETMSQPQFLQEIKDKADRFNDTLRQELLACASVKDIRGSGFLIGIETTVLAQEVIDACEKKGLLLLPAGKHVTRLLPSLLIEEQEWNEAVSILKAALN